MNAPLMAVTGFDDRIYRIGFVAPVVEALLREGVGEVEALRGTSLAVGAVGSYETRISLNQVLRVYENALTLSRDPHFAFHVGQNIHLSIFGIYGFAILTADTPVQAIEFAQRYQQLATPEADFSYILDGRKPVLRVQPVAHPQLEKGLYRFIIELHFSALATLFRDYWGPDFKPAGISVTFPMPRDHRIHAGMYCCPVDYHADGNRMVLEPFWLSRVSQFRNPVVHQEVVRLCDGLLEEMRSRTGIAGKVREELLRRGLAPVSSAQMASRLHMTERTLRRKLREEDTSYRALGHDLRMRMATKFLRDTDLSVKEIAASLGFSDDAAFRHAFHRWAGFAPLRFRDNLEPVRTR